MADLETTELVARIRTTAGLTQEQLARQLGVSFPTVNAWERGRSEPRPYHRASLDSMAKSLGIIQGLTALIIDDDPDVAGLMRSLLEHHIEQSVVAVASGSADGLLMCGAMKPDVVVLDYMMPGLDGLEVADALQRVDGLERTRVIFVTAHSDQEIRDALEQAGSACLAKPFLPEDFLTTVDAVVEEMIASATNGMGASRR